MNLQRNKSIDTSKLKSKSISGLIGAATIMATSAIGPGFLTQTSKFTNDFTANFAFVILVVAILDIGAQVNVWRIIGVSGMRAQDIANKILPGLGYFITMIVVLGGLIFNIGNVGGGALAFNILFGIPIGYGAIICGFIGSMIFLSKEAGGVIDKLTRISVIVMLIIVGYVSFITKPPVGQVVERCINPKSLKELMFPIVALLGGTVGGYITFSGGHKLIDNKITGIKNVDRITKSAVLGVIIASTMSVLIFLAVLGVVNQGAILESSNPAGSAFKNALGIVGYKLFGVVLLAASINTVIGATYTSMSFFKTLHPFIEKFNKRFTLGFIIFSTMVIVFVGKPAKLLILAAAFNGLILPITMTVMLMASRRKDIVGEYKHPTGLLIFGILIVIIAGYAGIMSLSKIF